MRRISQYDAETHFMYRIDRISNQTNDVARPQSYKTKTTYFFKAKTGQTKTTFSGPRPLFFRTIKLLTQDHWRSQKFWLRGAQIGKIFVTIFWGRFLVTSLKWRHNYNLKFDFVIISFKTTLWPNHGTSSHQYWRLRGAGDRKPPALGDFWKFVTKIVHFKHILAKI